MACPESSPDADYLPARNGRKPLGAIVQLSATPVAHCNDRVQPIRTLTSDEALSLSPAMLKMASASIDRPIEGRAVAVSELLLQLLGQVKGAGLRQRGRNGDPCCGTATGWGSRSLPSGSSSAAPAPM